MLSKKAEVGYVSTFLKEKILIEEFLFEKRNMKLRLLLFLAGFGAAAAQNVAGGDCVFTVPADAEVVARDVYEHGTGSRAYYLCGNSVLDSGGGSQMLCKILLFFFFSVFVKIDLFFIMGFAEFSRRNFSF